MADDFSQVSVVFDKTSYNAGDKMILTLSGQAVTQAGGSVQDAPTVTVEASDGTTSVITPAPVPIAITETTNLPVKMDAVSDPSGRQWVVAADGLSATATA